MSGQGSPSASASGSPEDLLHEWALATGPVAPPVRPGVSSAQALLQAAKSQPTAAPTTTESWLQKQLLDAAAQQTKADAAAAAAKSAADAKAKLYADALEGATHGRVEAILNSPAAKAVAAGKTAPTTDLGNTLNVGDYLGPGQRLTNGKYTLALQNGDLVLTDGNGSTLWDSNTTDATGKALWATFDSDGSIDIRTGSLTAAQAKWSTLAGLANAAKLVLNSDGSLVVVGKDGTTHVISPADKVKYFYRVTLPPRSVYHQGRPWPCTSAICSSSYRMSSIVWASERLPRSRISAI